MLYWLLRYYSKVRSRKITSCLLVLLLLLLCVFGNATTFWLFDGPPGLSGTADAELGFGDALWTSVISITTIGYGDYSARSLGSRLGTLIFIVVLGLSTFTVFFGMVLDWVTFFIRKGQLGMSRIVCEDHVLLVNFPGESRVLQIVDELRNDPQHGSRDIVVVTDQIETLPFVLDGVAFVRGSPLQGETYDRANASRARMALVLATSYSDTTSDAVVASAVAVLDRVNSDMHVVAECLDERHRMLFSKTRCNAVVPGLRIVGNLLVQEVHDPGVCQLIDVLTSNLKGSTLFSARVEGETPALSYCTLAKALVDHDVNLLSVQRDGESHTVFRELNPRAGDSLVYVADRRHAWPELVAWATSTGV